MPKCLLLFSGGLDSVVAAHVLKEQGLEVCALHFVLPFESGVGVSHEEVGRHAERLGVALLIAEEGEEFIAMMRDPRFGYGKHVNPCVDCRIHRLVKARRIMEEIGAAFIATGEVIGQRPMSQRRDSMRTVEKRSGLEGYLIRPLSALLLEPTIPEKEGIVDRDRLLAIKGRSRKEQLAYARAHGLTHGSPGGGCILTQEGMAERYADLTKHDPDYSLRDFKLLAYGRRFRPGGDSLLVVGRNRAENSILEHLARREDRRIELADMPGPLALLIGESDREVIERAAAIVLRYSRARESSRAAVKVTHDASHQRLETAPASEEECEAIRV
jgi:tRNA U34 2-thiouridine synthase MnmA/TrmU